MGQFEQRKVLSYQAFQKQPPPPKKGNEYLKNKLNELATHSNNKNIRDLYRKII
jgi:hypothetical protein